MGQPIAWLSSLVCAWEGKDVPEARRYGRTLTAIQVLYLGRRDCVQAT